MLKHLTAGRVAAFGLILFIVGNELSEPALRQVLEILAGVLAAARPLHPTRGALNPKPIDAHYHALRFATQGVFHELGIAA